MSKMIKQLKKVFNREKLKNQNQTNKPKEIRENTNSTGKRKKHFKEAVIENPQRVEKLFIHELVTGSYEEKILEVFNELLGIRKFIAHIKIDIWVERQSEEISQEVRLFKRK